MALSLYNVLNRRREDFEPLVPGRINMYVCGPTVYDYPHVGHGKLYVSMDVVVRYLRFSGYSVRYVQNITDVGHLLDTGEDRIMRGAVRERKEPMEIVEKYTREYFSAMDALGVTRPDISPRASAHVIEQIELIKKLIAAGHAYESNGSIYFDVMSWPNYGKLSGRKVEEQEAGARIDVREDKHHPADFALWKKAEPEHILRWPSPWGEGFPGWHIECSAMSMKYLGETFDIHGGGLENIFPHNECEMAQSEAYTGKPFARYWILTGSLTIDGVKMSKSLGNSITVTKALQRWRPEQIRLFILSSHYSSPVDITDAALAAAGEGASRLSEAVRAIGYRKKDAPQGDPSPAWLDKLGQYRSRFVEVMDDDFNAPMAISLLFDMVRETNALANSNEAVTIGTLQAIEDQYNALAGDVLGLLPKNGAQQGMDIGPLVELLIDIRRDLRAGKQFAEADKIRQQLTALGITLEDGARGTTWKKK
jgi:cysteinyl-tRNA synthetase